MVEQKEFNVPDFEPETFRIQIIDAEGPVGNGIAFNVALDDGTPLTEETKDKGILMVAKPREALKLSLKEGKSENSAAAS